MIRDHRKYIVFKTKDVLEELNEHELDFLMHIGFKLMAHRLNEGKDVLTTVVVEKDWPEYEKVWKLLEDRVDNESIVHS